MRSLRPASLFAAPILDRAHWQRSDGGRLRASRARLGAPADQPTAALCWRRLADLTIVIVLDVTALSPPPTTVALAGHVSRSSIARAEC